MIRLIVIADVALSVATSAHAMTPAPIPQPESVVVPVAAACGPGRTRVNGSALQEPPSATPAEKPEGVCDGTQAFALCTS